MPSENESRNEGPSPAIFDQETDTESGKYRSRHAIKRLGYPAPLQPTGQRPGCSIE
jgi:hypothetical protein